MEAAFYDTGAYYREAGGIILTFCVHASQKRFSM